MVCTLIPSQYWLPGTSVQGAVQFVLISLCACSIVTPSLSRAATSYWCCFAAQRRSFLQWGEKLAGFDAGKCKTARSTPRIVNERPSSVMLRPTIAGSAPPCGIDELPSWRQRFGADPAIVGRSMTLDGRSFTILGVLPSGFAFPGIETASFSPHCRKDLRWAASSTNMRWRARLKLGVTIEQAQSDMSTIARRLEQKYPATNTGWGIKVQTMRAALAEEARIPVLAMFAAVGFVLLLACVNVAGLLLARASGKTRELAIRASLGAGRAVLCAR